MSDLIRNLEIKVDSPQPINPASAVVYASTLTKEVKLQYPTVGGILTTFADGREELLPFKTDKDGKQYVDFEEAVKAINTVAVAEVIS